MPPVSEKQRRWAYAVKEGKVKGVSPSVGKRVLGEGEKKKAAKKSKKKVTKKVTKK